MPRRRSAWWVAVPVAGLAAAGVTVAVLRWPSTPQSRDLAEVVDRCGRVVLGANGDPILLRLPTAPPPRPGPAGDGTVPGPLHESEADATATPADVRGSVPPC